MADQKLLEVLAAGRLTWNSYRRRAQDVSVTDNDLTGVDLRDRDLDGCDLSGMNFDRANLSGTQLRDAQLGRALLTNVDLTAANLSGARMHRATLNASSCRGTKFSRTNARFAVFVQADITSADFSDAQLSWADFRWAQIGRTVFRNANLEFATFMETSFDFADMQGAVLGRTSIGLSDLSDAIGLSAIRHEGPSSVDGSTLIRSHDLPQVFLEGIGLPDSLIAYYHSLAATAAPIQFYSCFISYSSKDEEFCRRLHNDLQGAGVRCWFAPEDLKVGDRFRDRIEDSIRIYDKLLIVLSEHSVVSQWVSEEIEAALDKEAQRKEPVLFPIRLDDAVLDTAQAWARSIKRTRHIGDFRGWKDHSTYQKAFERLMRDLKASSAAT